MSISEMPDNIYSLLALFFVFVLLILLFLSIYGKIEGISKRGGHIE